MAELEIDQLFKSYGDTPIVQGIDLTVEEGEFVALLGPSGCGKTTTLRMVAGFTQPTGGYIRLSGADVTATPAFRRNTGMVFQSYALFPHMTVAQNVAFGLQMRSVTPSEQARRVSDTLQMVQLEHLVDRLPRELSGGQQQRVALARALVVNPSVLLLDEPLSNLDAKLRAEVRLQIRSLQKRLGLTTLMVTHDQEEALTMADRLVVMHGGRVRQIGSPEQIYESPADAFVAAFLGRCNLIEGKPLDDGSFMAAGNVHLPISQSEVANWRRSAGKDDLILALRPERIQMLPVAMADKMKTLGDAEVSGIVRSVNYLGSACEYQVDVGGIILAVVHPTHIYRASDGQASNASFPTGSDVILRWQRDAAKLVVPSSLNA